MHYNALTETSVISYLDVWFYLAREKSYASEAIGKSLVLAKPETTKSIECFAN